MPATFIPTPDHQIALDRITSFLDTKSRGTFILKGYAGTGKTTLVKAILSILREKERNYTLLASTGRAAKVMTDAVEKDFSERGEINAPSASTIHSLIYCFDKLSQDMDLFSQNKVVQTGHSNEIKLKFSVLKLTDYPGDPMVYIVDESSMISDAPDKSLSFAEYGNEGRLLNDLLNYDQKGQFIFIGDNCQLPPVTQPISPALSSKYITATFGISSTESELTQIVRQAQGNDIVTASALIREKGLNPETERFPLSFPLIGYNNVHIVDNEDTLINSYINDIRGQQYSKATLILLSNKKISGLSDIIRPALGFSTRALSVGDLLLVTQNNLISGLMNGDLVKVISIGRRELRAQMTFTHVQVQSLATEFVYSQFLIEEILYSGSTNITQEQQTALMIDFHKRATKKGLKQGQDAYNEMMRKDSYLNALRCIFGYALTCHKAQGGEWDKVYLEIPRNFYYTSRKYAYQWVYTAMTRAKKDLYILSDKLLTWSVSGSGLW